MILIKGQNVKFEMSDGGWVAPPSSHGIIHDPDGSQLERCFVYVGPYKATNEQISLTKDAKSYFGPDYKGTKATVDVPDGPWNLVGEAVQILYRRPGKYRGKYFHFFNQKTTVLISKCRNHFRMELPNGCIVNWRGFVFP